MSDTAADANANTLRIDIAADVICPWCVIGYKQLERALKDTGTSSEIRWYPFVLTPEVPDRGKSLKKHLKSNSGMSNEEIRKSLERIKATGAELGFTFNYSDDIKMVNTSRAHQLLCWAETLGKRHELNLALPEAYFTHQKDLNKNSVLVEIAASAGLDPDEALAILEDGRFDNEVRGKQFLWEKRGIKGLPAMIFNQKYLVSGAQGVDGYASLLREFAQESAA
jgi:predicted DsbA family dithiol-disulfide isomerase